MTSTAAVARESSLSYPVLDRSAFAYEADPACGVDIPSDGENPFAAARGIVIGLLLSAALWTGVSIAVYLFLI